jgi:hypothetical protein
LDYKLKVAGRRAPRSRGLVRNPDGSSVRESVPVDIGLTDVTFS